MKRPCVTIVSALLAALLLSASSASAGKLHAHHQRTRTKCFLPNHDYDDVVWPFTTPRSFGATAMAVADSTTPGQLRKPFHFRVRALTVDHLTLDQVGLTLYKKTDKTAGQLIATGRITHSGGADALIGSNVTIRLRAYVASTSSQPPAPELPAPAAGDGGAAAEGAVTVVVPNEATRVPPDAYVVWRSERKLWVSRGRPRYISLVPEEILPGKEKLNHHFGEITHLEVELEYQKDR